MYQLVNMYQPVFRQQPKILSAGAMAIIFSVAALFMLAVYLKAQSGLSQLQRTSMELALHQTRLNVTLGAANPIAPKTGEHSIEEMVNRLQDQIADQDTLLHQFEALGIQSVIGFGDVFELLAETQLSGLWLTEIRLDQGGHMQISGTTVDAALVPKYLKRLSQHPLLESLSSGTVNLIRDNASPGMIDFVLGHEAAEDFR